MESYPERLGWHLKGRLGVWVDWKYLVPVAVLIVVTMIISKILERRDHRRNINALESPVPTEASEMKAY